MRNGICPILYGIRGRSSRLLPPLAAAVFICAVGSSAHANAPPGTFVIFDVPGGALAIVPKGINPAGVIAGTYITVVNESVVFLGFLRARDSSFTTINVPGSTSTFVGSGFEGGGPPINPAGAVTGNYFDASGLSHGFLRAPDGTFTRFDAPGAVNGTDFVCCITPEGAIAGVSFDANFVDHGFLRAPKGSFTTFDVPGSTGTAPTGINPAGAITGSYSDASGLSHGFLRAGDGTITTFDAPGAVEGTQPDGINPARTIVGTYFDATLQLGHGFLRAPDGTFTTFDVPGSAAPFGTNPAAINPAGAIVGYYFDGIMFHGFLRAPDGTFTTVDPPGSVATEPVEGINPAGAVTGVYSDASQAEHGFLFLPH
jgi:hypothetical protein